MSELEVALKHLHKDADNWRNAAKVMEKAARDVAAMKDLASGFGYLGKKAECDTTYATLNQTLVNVGGQAGKVFQEIAHKLDTVGRAYEHAEEMNVADVKKIRQGWHI
ncbi:MULTISPECIES: hypothetical protein [Actinomadura]|uniref:hypothetical protein n=1 Tax=Actinomadura TaxID=1988 RepID=UPI001591EE96|nr:hypothetical protein [Actinomadura sp. NAK00032]QKW34261.1 hypothetical protein HUT06_09660 [Actinomadura sp. NAK00032]